MEALGNETIETLRETGIDRETQEERLRVLLNRGVAFNEIGRMVMGRYWAKANAQQRQRYLKAFKELTIGMVDIESGYRNIFSRDTGTAQGG